ncbi:MAG: hypothetical protein Q8S13_04140 [Dehalococcoidia bacterium]|nr:hypothetical protein [Dehalococcoidia bacterium]
MAKTQNGIDAETADARWASGACECGAPGVATERQYGIRRTLGDPDPDATLPGYRYTGEKIDLPICYPATPDRFTSGAFGRHVYRLAIQSGRPEMAAKIAAKFGLRGEG